MTPARSGFGHEWRESAPERSLIGDTPAPSPSHAEDDTPSRHASFESRALMLYRPGPMRKTRAPETFRVKSFGCQMNVYDGERMAELLGENPDEWIALAVAPKPDSLLQVIHRQKMILPVRIHDLEHQHALMKPHVGRADYRFLFVVFLMGSCDERVFNLL